MSEIKLMPSPHIDGAKALLEKIRALRAEIPRFTTEGFGEGRRLASVAAIPEDALESACVAIDVSPRLEQAVAVSAVALRDTSGFGLAYEPVAQELFALGRLMAHSIRVQKYAAGLAALDIYHVAQRLSKRKDGADLIPHVEDMRKKFIKRSRKTKSNPVPAPDVLAAPPAKV